VYSDQDCSCNPPKWKELCGSNMPFLILARPWKSQVNGMLCCPGRVQQLWYPLGFLVTSA
jgi:hypothetical protein